MDTKLKKMRKLKVAIISLCVLIPALVLTALYPKMEEAVNDRRKEYELEENFDESLDYQYLNGNFPNYVVEATYCMYANYLEDKVTEPVNWAALEEYGWTADWNYVTDNTEYYVEYGDSTETSNPDLELQTLFSVENSVSAKEEAMKGKDIIGYLVIEYDASGNVSKIELNESEKLEYGQNVRSVASESHEQYKNNVAVYNSEYSTIIDAGQVVPKNMKAIFAITEDSDFIWKETGSIYNTSIVQLYLEVGAMFLILLFAALVAVFALVLPFIKALDTGWEKPFSLPFEVMVAITIAGICGAFFMTEAMCYSSMYALEQMVPSGGIELVGIKFDVSTIYYILLVLNFLGWALLFWMEYMVVASFRQFLCGPKYYIKNRLLCVRFVRWIGRKIKELCSYVADVDLSEDLHKKLKMAVLINLGLVGLLCFGWFAGALGAIIYSAVLYYFLRKYITKIQNDYLKVFKVTEQLADGNLKVTIDEDLGVFQSLGDELEKVKAGFSKAVAEEAKSQNMKTELITNVSHDLKTPLTAIITYVDLLGKEGITEEERKSYIATLEKKSQRLKVLIEDLFEVSKASSGNVKLNLMDVDVVSLMKQVRTEMEDKIMDSDLAFRWNLPEDRIILKLDGQKTYRVFENLLNNILKYAMPHSRVYVDVLESDAEVQIMFRNISKVEMNFDAEHLTERFVRGEASRTSEGSGLGLAIAKSLVELQGGKFKIDVDGDLFKVTVSWKR